MRQARSRGGRYAVDARERASTHDDARRRRSASSSRPSARSFTLAPFLLSSLLASSLLASSLLAGCASPPLRDADSDFASQVSLVGPNGGLTGSALTKAALAMEQAGNVERARSLARQATERSSRDVDAWLALARFERKAGDLGAAAASYDRAERLDRGNPEIVIGRAQIELLQGRYERALELFELARRNRGSDPRVWVGAGVANDALGRHATAQEQYRWALSLDPDNAAARANLTQSIALADAGPTRR